MRCLRGVGGVWRIGRHWQRDKPIGKRRRCWHRCERRNGSWKVHRRWRWSAFAGRFAGANAKVATSLCNGCLRRTTKPRGWSAAQWRCPRRCRLLGALSRDGFETEGHVCRHSKLSQIVSVRSGLQWLWQIRRRRGRCTGRLPLICSWRRCGACAGGKQ